MVDGRASRSVRDQKWLVRSSVNSSRSCAIALSNTLESAVKGAEGTLKSLSVSTIVDTPHCRATHTGMLSWYVTRSNRLSRMSSTLNDMYLYAFSPGDLQYKDGLVDWIVGPLDTTLVCTTKDYIARFSPGPRICAEACQTLMTSRQKYKALMKPQTLKMTDCVQLRSISMK
jgi:hypothetical protein